MSAYIVADLCIARIIEGLTVASYTREVNAFYGVTRELALPDVTNAANRATLAAQMARMNADAVDHRYREHRPDGGTPSIDGLLPVGKLLPIQFLKSLHCYLYQCSEGDVTTRPLYLALKKVAQRIAENIVTHSPEYKAAEWG